jgi:hypothetical protein
MKNSMMLKRICRFELNQWLYYMTCSLVFIECAHGPFRACLGNGGFKWMEED